MKICYLGDVNIQVRLVSAHFAAQGHEVHICTFRPGVAEHATVHPLLSGRLRSKAQYLMALPRLRRILASVDPDVVHAFYVTSYGLLGSLSCPDRLVLNAMGSDILLGPRDTIWRRWLVSHALARARMILSVAPHLTERLVSLGAPPDKVETFPRGIDTSLFHPGETPVGQRGPTVICVRKMEPLYNHAVLLEAAPKILARNPEVRFVLCGDGSLKADLRAKIENLGVTKAFTFLGDTPHAQLPELLRQASVYFSGAVSDGTSVSLLEAMGAGAYPIVTDIAANRDWIEDGVNGSLFPSNDSEALAERILRALGDASARDEAARRNQEIVRQRASWSEGTRRLGEVYRRVAAAVPLAGR
jgi:glycosyltransferase involved in cell wall biosynthesis